MKKMLLFALVLTGCCPCRYGLQEVYFDINRLQDNVLPRLVALEQKVKP